jgi:hypothetical protein
VRSMSFVEKASSEVIEQTQEFVESLLRE